MQLQLYFKYFISITNKISDYYFKNKFILINLFNKN